MVTGSRSLVDEDLVFSVLSRIDLPDPLLIHGAARGADALAVKVAASLGWEVLAFPADWNKHGKAAGPIRNAEMIKYGPDLLVAFPLKSSIGTRHAMQLALKARIPVLECLRVDGVVRCVKLL